MNVHFCMGKQTGVELRFGADETHKCPLCGMAKKSKGCCGDEQSFLKLNTAHQVSADHIAVPAMVLALPPAIFTLKQADVPLVFSLVYSLQNQPPPDDIPLYKRNCVFLI